MSVSSLVLAAAVLSTVPSVSTHQKELERVRSIVGQDKGCRDLKPKEVKSILGAHTPKSFESASACVHAGGRAVSVGIVFECGGDACTVDGWLFTDVRPVVKIPHENEFDVSPDVQFLFYTRLTPTKNLGEYDVDVARRDLATGVDSSFAKCASPTVSPGGKWVLCRSRTEDVLKVPIGGGPTTVFAKGTGVVSSWTPYANIFPNSVDFPTATTMEVWIGPNKKLLPWKE